MRQTMQTRKQGNSSGCTQSHQGDNTPFEKEAKESREAKNAKIQMKQQ
jgi:hypothetical protein